MRRDVCPRCDSHSVVTWHGRPLDPNVSCFDQIGYRCEKCGKTYSYNQIVYYTTAELRPRTCPCCGKTYRPQYKAQRTCRECLDSGRKARRSYGVGVCERCGATYSKFSPRGKYCPKCRKKKFRKEKS